MSALRVRARLMCVSDMHPRLRRIHISSRAHAHAHKSPPPDVVCPDVRCQSSCVWCRRLRCKRVCLCVRSGAVYVLCALPEVKARYQEHAEEIFQRAPQVSAPCFARRAAIYGGSAAVYGGNAA
eukprot:984081-Rhodomonas_salina.1